MKLSKWAKENGLSYRTAWRMFHAGTLPVEAEQMATGTILVKARTEVEKVQGAALYDAAGKLLQGVIGCGQNSS